MSEQHEIDYLLTINVEPTYNDLRKLEMIIFRNLNALKRLTGSEEINQAINNIQRAIAMMRMFQITIRATQAAIAGTAGPLGWVYAATLGVGIVVDIATEVSSH